MSEKNLDLVNELNILNYCFQKPISILEHELKSELFLDPISRLHFKSIQEMFSEGLTINIDTFVSILGKYYDYNYEHVVAIYTSPINENISFHISKLKDDFLKHTIVKEGVTKWIGKASKNEAIDIHELDSDMDAIQRTIRVLSNKMEIYTGKELAELHKQEMEKRKLGISNRWSYGHHAIDSLFPRPCEEGQMSGFFGEIGTGKTAFALSLMRRQVRKVTQNGKLIPVAYISAEMKRLSFMDRSLNTETGVSVDRLNDITMSQEEYEKSIEALTNMYAHHDNFIFTDESSLGIKELDYFYEFCKRKWIELGVIDPSEKKPYMCIWIDTIDCLEIFGGMSPTEMKKGFDILAKFANKRNIHLCLIGQIGESNFRGAGKITFDEPDDIDDFFHPLSSIYGTAAAGQKLRATFTFVRTKIMKMRHFAHLVEELKHTEDILKLSLLKNNEGLNGNIYFEFKEKYFDFDIINDYKKKGR